MRCQASDSGNASTRICFPGLRSWFFHELHLNHLANVMLVIDWSASHRRSSCRKTAQGVPHLSSIDFEPLPRPSSLPGVSPKLAKFGWPYGTLWFCYATAQSGPFVIQQASQATQGVPCYGRHPGPSFPRARWQCAKLGRATSLSAMSPAKPIAPNLSTRFIHQRHPSCSPTRFKPGPLEAGFVTGATGLKRRDMSLI